MKHISKNIRIILLISVIGFSAYVLFYPYYGDYVDGELTYKSQISRYIDYVTSPTSSFTSMMAHKGCWTDVDVLKSNIINGKYSLDEPSICLAMGRIFYLNATSDIELMLECVDLYDMREREIQNNNERLCEKIGIPHCDALVIVEFTEFQEKYCDFW